MRKIVILLVLIFGLPLFVGTKHFKAVSVHRLSLKQARVAQWGMDDDTANKTVRDSSGNGYNGTAQRNTNLMHVTGQIRGALSFNGTTDYIDTGQTFQSVFQNSFTITQWVKITPKADEHRTFGLFNPDTGSEVATFLLPDENYWCFVYGTVTGIFTADLTLEFNASTLYRAWHMLAFTVEQSGNNIIGKAYVDSVLVDTDNIAFDMAEFLTANNTFLVGRHLFPDEVSLTKGSLDDVRIFNKALSQAEINWLYKTGSAGREG